MTSGLQTSDFDYCRRSPLWVKQLLLNIAEYVAFARQQIRVLILAWKMSGASLAVRCYRLLAKIDSA